MRFVLAYLDPGSGSLIVQVLLGGRCRGRGDDEDDGPPLVQARQEEGAEAEQADPEALAESGHEEIVDRVTKPGDSA